MRANLVAAKTEQLRKKPRKNQPQQVILNGVYMCYDGRIEMGVKPLG